MTFLFDGDSIVCSIYHHLRDIRQSNKMPKRRDENGCDGQGGEKLDLRHSNGNV